MIFYVQNLEYNKIATIIGEFIKVVGTTRSVYKNQLYFYMLGTIRDWHKTTIYKSIKNMKYSDKKSDERNERPVHWKIENIAERNQRSK